MKRTREFQRPSCNVDVAVVVPCYNAEQTLAAAVRSVLDQSVATDLVVVDDGSNDGTLALARTFGPDVRILSGPNQGVSAARNRGIAATKAEWLLFLDADDFLMPGTLGKRLETASTTEAEVIICEWQDVFDDCRGTISGGQCHSIDWFALKRDPELATATHVWATTSAIMYRRHVVERIGGFRRDLPVIQDARFLFDAIYHGARIARSPHIGANYRILPGSLSRRSPAQFWADVLRNGQQIEKLWSAKGALRKDRRRAAAEIYNNAARGLFAAADPRYFEAVKARRRLGLPDTLHSKLATPLAHVLGLHGARNLLRLINRT